MKSWWSKLLIGFFCVYILLMIKGCWGIFYVKMSHLSDEELEWVKNPIKYQRGTFESDSGNKASLIMLDYSISNSKNPFFFNVVESDRYEANATYWYMVKLAHAELKGFFFEYKSLRAEDSLVCWTMLNYKYSLKRMQLQEQIVNLNNRKFTNCLVIDSKNSEPYNRTVDYPIDSYIISKNFGLIYFKLESGEQYYRKLNEVTDTIQRY